MQLQDQNGEDGIELDSLKMKVVKAVQIESAYLQHRATIVAHCANPKCSLKQTKEIVDHVKKVIKGGKKYSSEEKLRSLRLLHKCIMKAGNNQMFLEYVQIKVMGRLAILATHCPASMKKDDIFTLKIRGANIFSTDEKDEKSASSFLVVLLNSIEEWAQKHQVDKKTGKMSIFKQIHGELIRKGYCFPSQWKVYKNGNGMTEIRRFGSASPMRNPLLEAYKAVLPCNAENKNQQKQRLHRYHSPPVDWGNYTPSNVQQPEPEQQYISELKEQIKQVRDTARRSQKYLTFLRQNDFSIQNLGQHSKQVQIVKQGLQQAKECLQRVNFVRKLY